LGISRLGFPFLSEQRELEKKNKEQNFWLIGMILLSQAHRNKRKKGRASKLRKEISFRPGQKEYRCYN
jgi:hypothetical protein